jgi:FecR protein
VRGRRIVAALAGAALVAAPAAAQPTPVGINAAVRNKVELRTGNKARPAVVRERVMLNDEVRTGSASQLQILLLDRSTFTVGANARIAIDRFVYDPGARSRSMGVSVTRGAFRFMSGRALGKPAGPVTVRTPVASIGIRGTIFEGVVGEDAVKIAEREAGVGRHVKSKEDEASLIVLRGPGPRTQGDTIAGAIDVSAGGTTAVLDGPDLAVYVPRAGAAPIGPFQISPAGLAALQSLLRPDFAPGGGGGGSHTARNVLIGVGVAAAAGVLGGGLLKGKKKKPKLPNPNQQPGGKP